MVGRRFCAISFYQFTTHDSNYIPVKLFCCSVTNAPYNMVNFNLSNRFRRTVVSSIFTRRHRHADCGLFASSKPAYGDVLRFVCVLVRTFVRGIRHMLRLGYVTASCSCSYTRCVYSQPYGFFLLERLLNDACRMVYYLPPQHSIIHAFSTWPC